MSESSVSEATVSRASEVDDGIPVLLDRNNLKDQIARALRIEIVTGRMHPGTTYKMGELAARYGASRTPMREAILELEAKGLVEITRGVGFRVSTPSPQDLRDSLVVREMLEVPAMASLVGRLSPADIEIARELLDDLGDAAERNDLTQYLERDRSFHFFLISKTGNHKLAEIIFELRDAQRVPGLTRLADEGNLARRHRDHIEMVDAIERGDAPAVEELVRRHLALSRLSAAEET